LNRQLASTFRRRARQGGVVLIVALIVMVATILAAIALVSSIDVATLIAGNLAFRQSGVQAADSGVEVARNWLMTRSVDSLNNPISPSYYATWNGGVTTTNGIFDPATFDWSSKSTSLAADATGNTVAYVIHRMCENTGDPATANCFTARSSTTGGNSNRVREPGDLPCFDPNTGANLCGSTSNPYYRITVRVTGPRSTLTYVQAVIY
jgi:type IV pilus assembly protein PilX